MPVIHSRMPNVPPAVRRLAVRASLLFLAVWLFRSLFGSSPRPAEIQSHGMIERVLLADKHLDVAKFPFLQSRIGRDDRPDMFDQEVADGIWDFWTRYQKPFIMGKDTAHLDHQVMVSVVDDLLKFNGWVTGGCQGLIRPFDSQTDNYQDLASADNLHYIAIVINNADHFVVDQLAIIVQLARRLGTRNIFVSMLDQGSTDSTSTLSDLSEAVLTMLGIAFRIRRVPQVTTTYYPLEEAEVRNLVLEPLHELHQKRSIKFHRVIWLKGFTCPTDILESLRVSEINKAAMVCGMDWAEHNGFFIFSDRWRTRDIAGDLFRQARSSSPPSAGPPRDRVGTERYAEHLPFQVFCCESGTHVVDPEQSYYCGIEYRASQNAVSISDKNDLATDPETPCMDSAQMWFCRDLWISAAKNSDVKGGRRGHRRGGHKRDLGEAVDNFAPLQKRQAAKEDDAKMVPPKKEEPKEEPKKEPKEEPKKEPKAEPKKEAPKVLAPKAKDKDEKPAPKADKPKDPKDVAADPKDAPAANKPAKPKANVDDDPAAHVVPKGDRRDDGSDKAVDSGAGTDQDAMDEAAEAEEPKPLGHEDLPQDAGYLIPNSAFEAARILVNPRCLTTYGGVSHTKLALDLFGGRHSHGHRTEGNYVLEDWVGAPDSFVCQEMRTTGGRVAPKSQRRVSFLLQKELGI